MSVILITGGARSGKSRYAEALAFGPQYYVATAQAFDDEMRERIALHRKRRGSNWLTFEAPLDLVPTLRTLDGWGNFVLVDCLTLWLSNVMLAEKDCEAEISDLIDHLSGAHARIVIVTNEVGLGIVPDNAMARRFRDLQGMANQLVAAISESVVMSVSGLPLLLKGPWPKPSLPPKEAVVLAHKAEDRA